MSIVTLTSDFGYRDHYAAMVKARIWQSYTQTTIVDVSHGIEPFNVAEGAHVLKAAYPTFLPNTVHIFAVQGGYTVDRHIAFAWDQHYFVGRDNGFVGLLAEADMTQCVELKADPVSTATFFAQTLYAPVAAKLAQGVSLQELGRPTTTPRRFTAKKPRIAEKKIVGHVIHVDHYGNLVTNITQDIFMQQFRSKKFEIRFARESIYKLHADYTQVEPGDCVCLFNSLALLEIAIDQGNASTLLGLQHDSPVGISFYV